MASQSPYREKPLLHHLSSTPPSPPTISHFRQTFTNPRPVDLLIKIINHTLLSPFFSILFPLAFRAQGFAYHHAPIRYSTIYFLLMATWYILSAINTRLTNGRKREFDWMEEVVVITGGAGGLGLLIAEVYGMRGVSVAVLDVKEKLEGGEEVGGGNVRFYSCDVGNRVQVREVAERIERELGTCTVLVNNAAVVNGKEILDLSEEEVERYVPRYTNPYCTTTTRADEVSH